MAESQERVAWFNGEFLPESQVHVSFRDFGFAMGDGVFDTARTVAHKPFMFEEHVERLYKSLGYIRLDTGIAPEQMLANTHEVLERNLPLLGPEEDYWVTQWISRGVRSLDRLGVDGPPTVIIECAPLPLKTRAKGMRDGLNVVTPSGIRRTPPEAISPRVKSLSYANLLAGEQEVQALSPGATCVLLDTRGCLCEGLGSNIFIIKDGAVYTPHERFVLAGLSRQTAIELARDQGLEVHEADIDLYDAYSADEAFITSTSWCLVPVRTVNGKEMASGGIPGPITAKLMEAYKERLGGFDYVGQYTRQIN